MGAAAVCKAFGHGAVQLTFDAAEAKDEYVEEVGLLTGGARTHHAC